MSVLLFRLNGVDQQEADEVRDLLTEHHIHFYQTDAGRWGISVAALWLNDKQQLTEAKQLLAAYQQQRSINAMAARARDKENQEHQPPLASLLNRFKQAPLQYLILIAAILAIIYISTAPFIAI